MKNNLVFEQKKILNFVKKYFTKKDSIFLKKSYFAMYANSNGSKYIKRKLYNKDSINIKETILSFLDLLNKSNISLKSNLNERFYFKNLIITWGNKSSFSKNGIFYDKYFSRKSSSYKSTFWIVLSEDIIKNKKIKKNVAILQFDRNLQNYICLFKILIQNIFNFIINKNNINQDTLIASKINNFILKNKNFQNLKNLIMPYEGQIFQKIIFNEQKKINKNIKTYGFDHSAPHSLATQLYYTKEGSPDKLIVSGINTKNSYSKFYNWPQKKILISFPSRFKKNHKNDFSNKIFLPYEFDNSDIIIKNIDLFIKNSKDKTLKIFDIRIHPAKTKDKKQLILKKKIEKLQIQNKIKFTKKTLTDYAIIVGFTTTPIVALEFNLTVVHICPNPNLDVYLDYFWQDIIVKRINKYCYTYSLKKFGKYLNFTSKDKITMIINQK